MQRWNADTYRYTHKLTHVCTHPNINTSIVLKSYYLYYYNDYICIHTQEQCNKLRAGEVRLEAERRRLREALEGAESRATRVELGRRSLEGEIQRLRVCLAEKETEAQSTQDRHDSMLKQVNGVQALTLTVILTYR